MNIIHHHPHTDDKQEILRHIHAACLRALHPYWQNAQQASGQPHRQR